MDLTAESIKKILEIGEISTIKQNDVLYSDRHLYEVKKEIITFPTIVSSSLTSLIDYIEANRDNLFMDECMIHVKDYHSVNLISKSRDDSEERDIAFKCKFDFIQEGPGRNGINYYANLEDFNILVQTSFILNENARKILKLTGNYKKESAVNIADDGITQSIAARTGVTIVENVDLPNPVDLQKIVTFPEIEQPSRPYVFRMNTNGEAGLFCTDSNIWHMECIGSIKEWIREGLITMFNNDGPDYTNIPVIG